MQLTKLKLQWMICIEILYIWLCSFFTLEHLECMEWYVGESMVFDKTTHTFREKSFYIDWGFDCLSMILRVLASDQHTMGIQGHQPCIKDKTCFLNTKSQYIPNETYARIL